MSLGFRKCDIGRHPPCSKWPWPSSQDGLSHAMHCSPSSCCFPARDSWSIQPALEAAWAVVQAQCQIAGCSGQRAQAKLQKAQIKLPWKSRINCCFGSLSNFSHIWEALQKSSALCNEAWRGSCQTLPQCLFRAAGFTMAKLSSSIPHVPFPTVTAPSSLSLPSLLQLLNCRETPEHLAASFQSLFRGFNCSLPAVPNGAKQLNPELENLKRSKAVRFQVCGVPRLSLCLQEQWWQCLVHKLPLLSPSWSLCDTDLLAGPSVMVLLKVPTSLLRAENAQRKFIQGGMVLARTTFWKKLNMDLVSVSFLIEKCLNQIWGELERSQLLDEWQRGCFVL